jgi:hypothetical protein
MRYGKIFLSGALLLALTACDDDGITAGGTPPPGAATRVINVGTEWGTVDFRFYDIVENLPTFLGVPFRGVSGVYQRVEPGTRQMRLFPFSTNPDTTSMSLLGDLSLPLAGDGRYTLLYAGAGATGAEGDRHRVVVLSDPQVLPSPAGNNIAVKVIHAAVGVGNVEVRMVPVDSAGAPLPANWRETQAITVNYLNQTDYVTMPARNVPRAAGTAAQQYRAVVALPGAATPLFAANAGQLGAPAPGPGAIGHGTVGPSPGVQIPGSVLTAVVSAGHVQNARGGGTAAARAPTVFLVVDKPLNVAAQ